MSDIEAPEKVTTAGWKKNSIHPVVCPSGTTIKIRIPNLSRLIEAGEIPQHLLEAALGAASGKEVDPSVELIKKQREFTDTIVLMSVVEPKITEADLIDIPYEDMDFLVQIATRQRDLDAVGDHIGGLTKSEKFRRFRGLDGGDEDVAGL